MGKAKANRVAQMAILTAGPFVVAIIGQLLEAL